MKRYSAALVGSACLIGVASLLSPASCWAQGSLPSIRSGGIVSAGAFGAFSTIAPGSWIEIYGTNLAIDSRSWTGNDFNGVNAPTSLDGTTVTIGGQLAFIDYISSGQVNAQVPSNVATGSQQVIVTTASGSSSPYTITVNAVQPGLLAPSSFNLGGTQYAAALFSDGVTYVLPPGSIAGLPSQRAQPGDTITFYGIGFGPVVPGIPAGQIVQESNTLASSLQIKFGTALASMTYDGLAPNAVGLYQINVVVPTIPSSDSVPLTFTLGGVAGTQTLFIAVQGSNATPQVQSLTLSASTAAGGGTVQGTVTLSAAAPAGGAVVALSSNSSAATVPATVTVPAGATSATFTITAGTVSSNQSATVTASYGGGSAQATLAVAATGGVLPQFSELDIYATQAPVSAELSINEVHEGQVGYAIANFTGTYYFGTTTTIFTTYTFGAIFHSVSVNGQTFTLNGVDTASFIEDNSTFSSYAITSGSVTVTLSPQGAPGVGSVSGTFTLTSPLTTLTGTISGSYVGVLDMQSSIVLGEVPAGVNQHAEGSRLFYK
jgi:uncharacterized protein (TIGR03437 family)